MDRLQQGSCQGLQKRNGGLGLELSAGLTLTLFSISDFPAAPPFVSQPKPLQLDT